MKVSFDGIMKVNVQYKDPKAVSGVKERTLRFNTNNVSLTQNGSDSIELQSRAGVPMHIWDKTDSGSYGDNAAVVSMHFPNNKTYRKVFAAIAYAMKRGADNDVSIRSEEEVIYKEA